MEQVWVGNIIQYKGNMYKVSSLGDLKPVAIGKRLKDGDIVEFSGVRHVMYAKRLMLVPDDVKTVYVYDAYEHELLRSYGDSTDVLETELECILLSNGNPRCMLVSEEELVFKAFDLAKSHGVMILKVEK